MTPPFLFTRRSFCRLTLATPLAMTGAAVLAKTGAAGAEVPLTFGVVADPQYCDYGSTGSRHYRQSIGKLERCVAAMNDMDLSFAINLGDFIDRDFASIDRLLPTWKKLRCPSYQLLGNHDFSVADEQKAMVPAALGMPARYYDFKRAGCRFVVLDSNDISLHAAPEKSTAYNEAKAMLDRLRKEKVPQAQPYNGALGKGQLEWLEKTLADADAAQERVIVFGHHPVFPAGAHNLWNAEELVAVLSAHKGVIAYMNGHNHKGNYGQSAHIHYVNFKGMVETENETAFATVSVYPDRIEIDGYGLEPDRVCQGGG